MSAPFVRSDRELQKKLCAMVTEKTGIQLPENKTNMIEGRLRKRVRALGLPDTRSYLRMVMEDGHLEAEWAQIVDVMTTNKTDFFRENAHFRFMTQNILPNHPKGREFRFWSAASSSGEEAYTASMVLSEFAETAPGFTFSILGTDISKTVVKKARQGVYTPEEIVDVPEELQAKYLQKGHDSSGRELSRVVDRLRNRVTFAALNLTQKTFPIDRNMDVAFLRNVLIYFDEAMQAKVVSSVVDHVRPGGFLFVGHSESAVATDPRLTQVAAAVFRKETKK